MRFLVDECTGPAVAQWLRSEGHDVFSVYDQARGLRDGEILARAAAEGRVVITNDKDFGELVVREQRPHRGVVLLRLTDERAPRKAEAVQRLLAGDISRMEGRFVVVTDLAIRVSVR